MNLQLKEKCFSPVIWNKLKLDDKILTRCYLTENIDTEFISAFIVRRRTVMENRIAAGVLLTVVDETFVCEVMNIYFSSVYS